MEKKDLKDELLKGMGKITNDTEYRDETLKAFICAIMDVPIAEFKDIAEKNKNGAKNLAKMTCHMVEGRMERVIRRALDEFKIEERLIEYGLDGWQVEELLKVRKVDAVHGVYSLKDNKLYLKKDGETKEVEF